MFYRDVGEPMDEAVERCEHVGSKAEKSAINYIIGRRTSSVYLELISVSSDRNEEIQKLNLKAHRIPW